MSTTSLRRRYGHNASTRRLTAREILSTAITSGLGSALHVCGPPTAYFCKYVRQWVVEFQTDPMIRYIATRDADGSISFISED